MPVLEPIAAEEQLFGDSVACDIHARVGIAVGEPAPGSLDEAERVLRDIATVDERRGEESDPSHTADPALRRVEAKLDLTLRLLSQALPGLQGPAFHAVRLSAHGLRIDAAEPWPEQGATLRWQPADWMPICLSLPVTPLARTTTQSWWAFQPLGESLADVVARHVFRLHRRWLATHRRD